MDEKITPWFKEGLKFKCTGCGKCCTGSPGYVFLSEEDTNRLAEKLGIGKVDFLRKYTRLVDGSVALLDRPGSEDCIFLKNKECSVYEARPVQCKTFPWWLQHLEKPSEWEEAATRCEGINHPDAETVPCSEIEEQCFLYLDNMSSDE